MRRGFVRVNFNTVGVREPGPTFGVRAFDVSLFRFGAGGAAGRGGSMGAAAETDFNSVAK